MNQLTPKYLSGESIQDGDRINYSGENGIVEFVITGESPDWGSYWNKLGAGAMLKVPSFGSVYVPFETDELEFVSRNTG